MDSIYRLNADESPSEGVFNAVAITEICAPIALTPLATAIDPDALDTLLAGTDGTVQISFTYCGYDVTVTADEVRL